MDSALGMGHILPYTSGKRRRAAAPGGCDGPRFTWNTLAGGRSG
ncbi:hypothetical protein STXM2123_4671 [Streptomyces sp. F-3]|nr:hypothetical protein STXM2123_4671 [Streptomyces sp. F-3]